MDVVNLLNNQMDEQRVLALMDKLDCKKDAHAMYVATKYALARWMRRVSAHWASQGVRINAVAPGNVETAMTAKLSPTGARGCNGASNSHALWAGKAHGSFGYRQFHCIPDLSASPWYQWYYSLLRWWYRCAVEHRKGLLRRST